jgi:hypothetical protein
MRRVGSGEATVVHELAFAAAAVGVALLSPDDTCSESASSPSC